VSGGLVCGLGCTPALSVTHNAVAAAVCGLERYAFTVAFSPVGIKSLLVA